MKNLVPQIAKLATRLAAATRSPAKLAICFPVLALALALGAPHLNAATVTNIVGTCTTGNQFKTIQAALDASPAPNTVEVCPGTYYEQVEITKPVTVEGIADGNGSLAQIELPPGYKVNATVNEGSIPVVAQIYVNNVSGGSVNLTNLSVNGVGYDIDTSTFIGVLYNESSGTINRVSTWAQNDSGATNVDGWGMWIQGGSANPSVTVENSSVHDFSGGGILAMGVTNSPDLTVTIKNNSIYSTSPYTNDLVVEEGSNPTISGNLVSGGLYGIITTAPTGSITSNTVMLSDVGIELGADGPSVKSNNIFETTQYAIDISAGPLKTSLVESNTIRTVKSAASTDSDGTGIELRCSNISSSRVNSNTIVDSFEGYGDAPAGFGGSNTYAGVFFDVYSGSCASGSASSQVRPAARLTLPGRSPEQ